MTKGKKRARSCLCGVVAFLLCVSLTLAIALTSIKVTAFNPGYAVRVAEKSGFSQKLQAELKEEFISYGNACNVDESFFDDAFEKIITTQQITDDFSQGLKAFYNNETTELDTSAIEAELLAALENYAGEKGFSKSEALTQSLSEMSVEMGDLYSAYVAIFQASHFSTASAVLVRVNSFSKYALTGLVVFALAAAAIIRLSYSKAKNYLRYYIYAFSGSTLMLIVAPAVAIIMKIGSKINIANASLYGFASTFINGIFVAMLIAAGIAAVFTALLALARNKAQKNNK